MGATMQTGERHAYAVMMLVILARLHQCAIGQCEYDIICAFEPTWKRYLAAHPELMVFFSPMLMVCPEFHRYMHQVLCQVRYAAYNMPGAGVPGAETAEQFWSRFGLLAGRLLTMGTVRKQNYLEYYAFRFNFLKRVRGMPSLVVVGMPSLVVAQSDRTIAPRTGQAPRNSCLDGEEPAAEGGVVARRRGGNHRIPRGRAAKACQRSGDVVDICRPGEVSTNFQINK